MNYVTREEIAERAKELNIGGRGIRTSRDENDYKIGDFEAIQKAIEFCAMLGKTKVFYTGNTSYGLKHVFERYTGCYIHNSDFIVAMSFAGFRVKEVFQSPNCFFNISKRSINAIIEVTEMRKKSQALLKSGLNK